MLVGDLARTEGGDRWATFAAPPQSDDGGVAGLFLGGPSASPMLDEERGDALELQSARGVERSAAVAVHGIHVDALRHRERDRLEHQGLAFTPIRWHPRCSPAHAGGRHHGGGDV
jgi:hypothetical protein